MAQLTDSLFLTEGSASEFPFYSQTRQTWAFSGRPRVECRRNVLRIGTRELK